MDVDTETAAPLPPPPTRKPAAKIDPQLPTETEGTSEDKQGARLIERFRKVIGTFAEQAPSQTRTVIEAFFPHSGGSADRSNLPVTLRRHPLNPDAFTLEGRNRWMLLIQMIGNAAYTAYEYNDARRARNEAGITAMRDLLAKRIAALEEVVKLDDFVVGGSDLKGFTLITKAQRLAEMQAIERSRGYGR